MNQSKQVYGRTDGQPALAPVVILSSGRSGSTLLQKLLNTHPELVIWGEHAGFLNGLMRSWKAVMNAEWIPDKVPRGLWLMNRDRPVDAEKWTAWDGPFSKVMYHEAIRGMLDSLLAKGLPDEVRWGFKEIRYHDPLFI